jgi:WD40-like Beta Propeller Repeat
VGEFAIFHWLIILAVVLILFIGRRVPEIMRGFAEDIMRGKRQLARRPRPLRLSRCETRLQALIRHLHRLPVNGALSMQTRPSAILRLFRAKLLLVIVVFGSLLYLAVANHHKSVLADLTRLQKQKGLSLATTENRAILAIIFSRSSVTKVRNLPGGIGAISPDGTQVAFVSESPPFYLCISGTDGSDYREYRNVRMPGNNCVCWSHDRSKLVIGSLSTGGFSNASVQLFDVRSGVAQEVAKVGRVTSQCWSPDNKHFVYESDANLNMYDVEGMHSNDLQIRGAQATWSPDGRRVAFLDNDTYYVANATETKERQALFQRWNAVSGLWWSPDSRFVAYVSQAGLLEGGFLALDSELYWLRVRRLEDNSESRVAWAEGLACYQWVTNRELLRPARFRGLKEGCRLYANRPFLRC